MDTVCFQTTEMGNRNLRYPRSNPTLPPHPVILQFTPSDDLYGLGNHSFGFDHLNRVVGQLGLNSWLTKASDSWIS
jgi:hypothetical protein